MELLNRAVAALESIAASLEALARPPAEAEPPPVDVWQNADWSLSDSQLARKLGVSRQRVHQKRQAVNAQASDWKERQLERVRRMLTDTDLSARQIAEQLGVTHRTIYGAATELGISIKGRNERLRSDPWRQVDWDQPNYVIARKLGVTPQQVSDRRREVGAPPAPKGGPGPQRDWESVDWSQPNVVIAETLGVTASYVSKQRRTLSKPPAPNRRRKE